MLARDMQHHPAPGLHTFEAEFFTDHLIIRGETWGPDSRLWDHINSTAASIDLHPLAVQRIDEQVVPISTEGSNASLAKSHLLLILPLSDEIRMPADAAGWSPVVPRSAWALVGQYAVAGTVAIDRGVNDHRIALRHLEQKPFLSFSGATITGPGGRVRQCRTVIVNRERMELLALVDPD